MICAGVGARRVSQRKGGGARATGAGFGGVCGMDTESKRRRPKHSVFTRRVILVRCEQFRRGVKTEEKVRTAGLSPHHGTQPTNRHHTHQSVRPDVRTIVVRPTIPLHALPSAATFFLPLGPGPVDQWHGQESRRERHHGATVALSRRHPWASSWSLSAPKTRSR